MPRRQQRPRHAWRVCRPSTHRTWREPGQRDCDRRLALLPGRQRDRVVIPPCGGGAHAGTERERQREPVVVVGVLTAQIDPASGIPDTLGFAAIAMREQSDGVLFQAIYGHYSTQPTGYLTERS